MVAERGRELEQPATGQWRERDPGGGGGRGGEPIAEAVVQRVDPDVAEQHADRFVGRPLERDPQGASHGSVGADKIVRCDVLGAVRTGQHGPHPVGVLGEIERLLQALLEDFAAEGDTSAEASAHDPDFTKPAAVEFHIEQYRRFARRNWPVLRAVTQAALVDGEFARLANRFTTGQLEEVVDHVDGFGAAGLRLPSTPDVSVAMMFLLIRALLEAVEEGVLAVDDEQAVAGLTRFVYRGLTGRDY